MWILISSCSVVDKETQYFIAEATKTVMLSDTRKFDREGDSLWVGCTSVPKAGRLCEASSLPPNDEGELMIIEDGRATTNTWEIPMFYGYGPKPR